MPENVTDGFQTVNEKIGNRRFIKSAVFRHLLGDCDTTTMWRLRKQDPRCPVPHARFGYLLDEVLEYIEILAAERGNGDA